MTGWQCLIGAGFIWLLCLSIVLVAKLTVDFLFWIEDL